MKYILLFCFLVSLSVIVISCKSKANQPHCPDGYWKVPEGWKCKGYPTWGNSMMDMVHCANDYKCMNHANLCNGRRSIRREDTYSHGYGWNESDANYPNGSPDENLCTDEFCLTLTDGRRRRCPGTTRCISPTVNYPGTDIPIGPICAEELFSQFQPIELNLVNGSSMIQCQNGEMAKVGDHWSDAFMFRASHAKDRCTHKLEPLCSDHSDVTAKTCAWACQHYRSHDSENNRYLWPCAGEAKCIGSNQICDGVPDCGNGQDEDENLCTEDFCKNGYVFYDFNGVNFSSKHDDKGYYKHYTDVSKIEYIYLFKDYRYPYYPPNQIDYYRKNYAFDSNGTFSMAKFQNMEMPKCRNSTKCLRRSMVDDGFWKRIEC